MAENERGSITVCPILKGLTFENRYNNTGIFLIVRHVFYPKLFLVVLPDNSDIQIQSSSSSTSKIAKLTLNLGIVSKELIAKENITDPDIGNSHWRQRIGNYRDKPQDYWWIIDSADNAEKASREIVDLIANRVLPEWEQIRSTADLKRIWESGKYYGLTEGQRKYYLELIEK